MDFHSKNVKIDNQDVRLLLFDTAGQEKFRSLIPMYIRDANIVILVYDITSKRFKMNFKLDKESFKHVTTHWLDQIKDFKKNDAIFALVGNKLDLSDSKEVTREEALAVAKEKKFIFHEVSALSGENINSLFYKDIFDQIVNQFRVSMDDNEESN
jgi:Ras-related protein Rab-6A